MKIQWTAWATIAALLVYFWTIANVGKARGKFKIAAPAMDGPILFQSVIRVQINTAEQLILFLPCLWMCALFFSDQWAALGGAIWVLGRILYALGYYKAPEKRGLGFGISLSVNAVLMIGSCVGLLLY